jgi:hypothetical protein
MARFRVDSSNLLPELQDASIAAPNPVSQGGQHTVVHADTSRVDIAGSAPAARVRGVSADQSLNSP